MRIVFLKRQESNGSCFWVGTESPGAVAAGAGGGTGGRTCCVRQILKESLGLPSSARSSRFGGIHGVFEEGRDGEDREANGRAGQSAAARRWRQPRRGEHVGCPERGRAGERKGPATVRTRPAVLPRKLRMRMDLEVIRRVAKSTAAGDGRKAIGVSRPNAEGRCGGGVERGFGG
jgi:hypothetical protein